jgi:hypothetical protein
MISFSIVWYALGWGPFTHQGFGSHDPDRGTSAQFKAGCSAPDAFKGVEPSLHGLPFAAALYDFARLQKNNSKDAIDFALGFGCHLTHDFVGHHANGFLNPEEDHPLEIATDAFVYHQARGMKFEEINDEMTSMVVQASTVAGGSIHAITQSDGSSSVLKFRALTTSEEGGIAVDPTFKASMIKDSFCNVSAFEDVQVNFDRSANWSQAACSQWQQLMLNSSTHGNASQAISDLTKLVNSFFVANGGTSCTLAW